MFPWEHLQPERHYKLLNMWSMVNNVFFFSNASLYFFLFFFLTDHITHIVLAIEMIAACQAIDFRHPKKLSGPLKKVHDLVRTKIM